MRRGQLLSFDALLAVVIVIFMLGAVSATSDNLKSGLTNLLGWYDRTSIPDTMLDVLLKSPGSPPNWSENVSTLAVPGLRSYSGQYVDYNKAVAFFDLLKNNDSRVEKALLNLSLKHPFLLDFYLGKWTFKANFSWNPNAGGGIPPGFSVYNGSCSVAGTTNIDFTQPTIIPCDPEFFSHGSLSINSNSDICIVHEFRSVGSSHLYISSGGNLVVGGDWVIDGAVTTDVDGSAYIMGALVIRGEGSRTINIKHDLYIFGETSTRPLISVTGAATINIGTPGCTPGTQVPGCTLGNLYVNVNGVWYAANRSPITDPSSWYKWTGSGWEKLDSLAPLEGTVFVRGTQLVINIAGHPLSSDWTPPSSPECLNYGSGQPLTISSLEGNYTYPQQLNVSQAWNRVAYLNGSFLVNPTNVSNVFATMNASSWVSYSERNTVMSLFKYNRTTWIVGNSKGIIFGGVLRYSIPNYALLKFVVPNETGYVLIMVVDGGNLKVLGVWKTSGTSMVMGQIWELANGTVRTVATYRGSSNSLTVPWGDVFSSPGGAGRPVLMYLYSNTFTLPVEMVDEGDIGVLLSPMYEPLLVKLWVWDER
ncbi:hypothetical protein [Thermococcus henrietii]|uniref:hypothetical protein n=1 Tax=Thermococcus henrietii TaxID=2016361 RepID=UPI000C076A36|nr:hypothetical protein [Thermococcus henrietii]